MGRIPPSYSNGLPKEGQLLLPRAWVCRWCNPSVISTALLFAIPSGKPFTGWKSSLNNPLSEQLCCHELFYYLAMIYSMKTGCVLCLFLFQGAFSTPATGQHHFWKSPSLIPPEENEARTMAAKRLA